MDRVNLKLLQALSKNARASYAELAKHVHLSAPAVAERIKRMEDAGVITGYQPLINLEKIGIPITALIDCQVYKTKERAFKTQLLKLDEVIKIYNVTGETTFIVHVGATTMSHLDVVIEHMIDYCDTTTKLIMTVPYNNTLPQHIEKLISVKSQR